jgi:hypothetical protein
MRFYNVQNNKKKNGTPKCQSQEKINSDSTINDAISKATEDALKKD